MKAPNVCAFNFGETLTDFNRALKKGRRSANEFVDDASFLIRKRPLKSVGMAFGVALAMGAIAGRFSRR
jgi:ElaB/YqjD/DUF883 family membrane-anchored ribosome-binding protein